MAGADGAVYAFGSAGSPGSLAGTRLNQPIVTMAATPTGDGLLVGRHRRRHLLVRGRGFLRLDRCVAAQQADRRHGRDADREGLLDGGVRRRHLLVRRRRLSSARPVRCGSTSRSSAWLPTPTGKGYWLVATDGGIFSFGDAAFFGSTGALRLNKPIVAMAGHPQRAGLLAHRLRRRRLRLRRRAVLRLDRCHQAEPADCRHGPDALLPGLLVHCGRRRDLRFRRCRLPRLCRRSSPGIPSRYLPRSAVERQRCGWPAQCQDFAVRTSAKGVKRSTPGLEAEVLRRSGPNSHE